jgi:hypothetical protein
VLAAIVRPLQTIGGIALPRAIRDDAAEVAGWYP